MIVGTAPARTHKGRRGIEPLATACAAATAIATGTIATGMVARLKALSKMVENRHSRLSWGQVGVLPALIWCLRTRTRTPASMRGHKGFPRLGRGQAGFQLRARTLHAVKLMDHVQVCSSQVSKVKSRKRRKRRKRSTNHNALCGSPELSLDYANITVYTPGVTLATRTEPALRTLPLPSNGLPRKHVSCGCRRSRRRPHFIQRGLFPSPPSPGRPYVDGLVRRAPSRASCHARASSTVSPCGISICS